MRRDWFAAFSSSTAPELRASGATGVTTASVARLFPGFSSDCAVAPLPDASATGATLPRGGDPVAPVAPSGNRGATARPAIKSAEARRSRDPVAPVAPVAPERGISPQHVADAADAADWRDLFEERAAIRQWNRHYPRALAERLAYGEVMEGWLVGHPLAYPADWCAGCGEPLGLNVLDLPDGARVHFEPHREFRCLIAHGAARKRRAVAALAALGLSPPARWEP